MTIKQYQTNFTSGELDPLLAARIDVRQYYNGAEKLRNVWVIPQGGAYDRNGLEYLATLPEQVTRVTSGVTISAPNGGTTANANDGDTTTELTTTVTGGISTTNPFVVVHYDLGSAKTIKFADIVGFSLDSGSVAAEFFIQYSTDNMSWTSLGNAVPAISTAGQTRSRRSSGPITARYWRFARIGSTDLSTAQATIQEFNLWQESGTLSAVRLPAFTFSITQAYQLVFTDQNIAVYKDKVWQVDVRSPFTSAQLSTLNWTQSLDTMILVHEDVTPQKLVRQGDHDEWQVEAISFGYIPYHAFTTTDENPATTLTPSGTDGSVTLTAGTTTFDSADVGQIIEGNGGRARIVAIQSTVAVTAVVLIPFYNTTAIASGDWTLISGYEAVWSSTRGYPLSCVFHEGRLYFGGSKSRPSTLWGSRVGSFFNFDPGQNFDDEGIDVTLDSDDVAAIYNMVSGRHLQLLTSSSEYFIPQNPGQPITPDNVSFRRSTSHGSKRGVRPVNVSGATLFLQRQGKAMREFLFNDVEQSYISTNISLLSSHLISSPTDVALRKSTSTDEGDFVMLVNDDGTMAMLTTLRDQEVTAWTLQSTAGDILSVGVDDTDIYVAVERTIASTVVRYLEVFNENLHMDAGVYTEVGSPVTVVTGLEHLEGQTVDINIDGLVQPQQTVASGQITLARAAESNYEIGIPISGIQIKTMPVIVQLKDGSHAGKKVRIRKVMIELKDTTDLLVNGVRPSFREFGEAGVGSPLNTSVAPYTGKKFVRGLAGWSTKAQTEITRPLPSDLTVLGMELYIQM